MNTSKNGKRQSRERENSRRVDLNTMVYGKVPPQARELEEAILGAVMLEKGAFDLVSEYLQAQSFYVDAHQRIFNACNRLVKKSYPIDILTVVEELKAKEELDMVGGPYFVTKLTNSVVSTANLETHCRIVYQKHIQRELIRISGEITYDCYEDSTDVFDILDEAEEKFFKLTTGHLKSDYTSTAQLAVKSIEKMDQLLKNRDHLTGVPTGFPALDRVTCGWQPTDLIILAARPSVGKTAFALNLARNAAMDLYKPTPVAIFTLEMSGVQLMDRLTSAEGQIDLSKITRGRLEEYDLQEYHRALDNLASLPIYIDDTPALNIFEFKSKARRLVNKNKVGLIIIDYLQLMSGTQDDNVLLREQEISKISRTLKALAKDLQVPIIALSQLSRAIESRKGGEPMLSDLRESGAIEQDADFVGFLTRPDYQVTNGDETIQNLADLYIKKNRQGTLEKLAFNTDLSIQTWFDLDQYQQYQVKKNLVGCAWRPVKIEKEHEQHLEAAPLPPDDDDMPF